MYVHVYVYSVAATISLNAIRLYLHFYAVIFHCFTLILHLAKFSSLPMPISPIEVNKIQLKKIKHVQRRKGIDNRIEKKTEK